ncbi:MAG TPA: type IX secretion system protein PorQ [Flavisolibacter sp.]|nr:type IX secretion system protein PorQ [Flavisolibacter sp.]
MRTILVICFLFGLQAAHSQTLGGNAAYNFLKLPSSPLLTAAGGVNVSYRTDEVGLSANNPSLLDQGLHSQLNLSFNSFLAGIKTYSLTGALHHEASGTTFGGHIYFVDYGSIPQTDAAGNRSGEFRPVDFSVQVSAGKKYLENWSYGASLKFLQSSYGQYRSAAIAMDVGVLYADSSRQFTASVLAKNMGVQLSTYAGSGEDLPFDLQLGVSKRLANAPLGFSFTAQTLQRFDILYSDPAFDEENGFTRPDGFFPKLFNHFVIATHVYLGRHLEATAGYNHLRRTELNVGASGNGLNGFSMGLRLKFEKLQVLYARSNYQRNIAFNQLGLTMQMNKLFGLGKDL